MSQTLTEPMAEHPSMATLSDSERYRILESEQRQRILAILAEQTTPVELRELATETVAQEAGSNASDEEAIERVALKLHHKHLPMMDEKGVVDYDPGSKQIEPTW